MDGSIMREYGLWLTDPFFDEKTRSELHGLNDLQIRERFDGELRFGTGGLRGKMGAGTTRMNRYTVGRASLGLGRHLLKKYSIEVCRTNGVAIAYDTRFNSRDYAKDAACVLSGLGIRAMLFRHASPTPQLSFAIRKLGCVAGIVITASHNPGEDNGYKVYDEHGGQMVPDQIRPIAREIREIRDFREVSFESRPELICETDMLDEYTQAVCSQSLYGDAAAKADLTVVYTPLHGTGLDSVERVLKQGGFKKVSIVQSQAKPDGAFPTVRLPNPEDPCALEEGIRFADEENADIVLATDPDADRVGVAVRTPDGFVHLDGNQIGALLTDFVLRFSDIHAMTKPAVLTTVVSSQLGAEIARSKGISVFRTLTGFKYIGEKMTQFEKARMQGDRSRAYRFVFGYEESHGYLAGDHVRDKDGVATVMLVSEMAAYWKKQGRTLVQRMDELERQFGYCLTAQIQQKLAAQTDSDGLDGLLDAMGEYRFVEGEPVRSVDYRNEVASENGFGVLPSEKLLMYHMEDGSWTAVRPSGTESKLKMYLCARGKTREETELRLAEIKSKLLNVVSKEYWRLKT